MSKTKEKKDEQREEEKEEWISSIFIAIIIALALRIFIFAPTIVVGQSMEPTLHDKLVDRLYDNDRLIAERISCFLNIKIKRGDIITFTEPHSIYYTEQNLIKKAYYFFKKKEYIKRVIGIEGDHVQIKGDSIIVDNKKYNNFDIKEDKLFINGKLLNGNHKALIENAYVYINGEKQEEDYINGAWQVNINVENGEICPGKYFGGYGNEDINLDVIVPEGYVYVMGDNRNNSSDSRKFSTLKNDLTTINGCVSLKEHSGRIVCRFWPFDRFGKV